MRCLRLVTAQCKHSVNVNLGAGPSKFFPFSARIAQPGPLPLLADRHSVWCIRQSFQKTPPKTGTAVRPVFSNLE
jgi:hypothetical protein